ncbi:MAG: hypothetical protein WC378_19605 [Opitutaceae bacterium]|jgi:hypothetical protein
MNSAALQSSSIQLATPLRFCVPLEDLAEFTALQEKRRVEVNVTLQLLDRVHALRGEGNLGKAIATVAANSGHLIRGCSVPSLTRKYYAYLGSGCDWRSLVASYRGPSSMPESFETFVKKVAEDNHRSMAEAFDLIRLEYWAKGLPIPGYGTWTEYYSQLYPERPLPKVWPRGFFPQGWSKRNLYRKTSCKGARVIVQRGLAAAKRYFPSLKRDPSQLRPMEVITIDDFVLDCLCAFPGDGKNPPQIAPVAGLLAMDVGTRRKLAWGCGAQVMREEKQPDGTIKKVRCGIRRVDVQMLIHDLFARCGLPPYTVTLLVENATASIGAELELALSALFEGRVVVERTGLIDHRTLSNGFTERGGKPWEKGWIESAFNYLWNKLGSQPGYKGSNARLTGPKDIDAKIQYTQVLLGQGDHALNLPPEKIALLRLPFPSPQALEQAFARACIASDLREDHKYIGFDKVTEFLLEEDGEPQPFSALALLSPEKQMAVEIKEHFESPMARWDRLSKTVEFKTVPASVLAIMLLTPKKVVYRNHSVTFLHDKVGYTYIDTEGSVFAGVPDGSEFLGYLDSSNPENLTLSDLKGAFAGILTRLGGRRGMVGLRDKEAIKTAAAQVATVFNRTLSEVRERHADQDALLAADRVHNQAIVDLHKAETADLSKAERIGLAAGDVAAAKQREREQARAMRGARDVSADLLGDSDKDHFIAAPHNPGAELLSD